MCLGIPGKVLDVAPDDGLLMGRVDFGGVIKRICLEHVADAKPGDYVLVHVGFALARIDEDEAKRVLALLEETALLAELGEEEDGAA
jgi:hydrogenase expression/formation protein HypC